MWSHSDRRFEMRNCLNVEKEWTSLRDNIREMESATGIKRKEFIGGCRQNQLVETEQPDPSQRVEQMD